jgi:DNA transformation protein
MAAALSEFEAFVQELFAPLGPVAIRRMFGGAGVYAQGRMFALLAFDTIYLKADAINAAAFDAEGCAPFVYEPPSGKAIAMSYRMMPEAALDDPEEAVRWGRLGLEAALRAPAKPARARRKP